MTFTHVYNEIQKKEDNTSENTQIIHNLWSHKLAAILYITSITLVDILLHTMRGQYSAATQK